MTITHKDKEVFYTVEGQGKPVVFLHGFLENHGIFNPIISELISVKAILIDLPGHGRTPVLDGENTMQEMAAMVRAILSQEGIDQAMLVGHSMGGYVALAFAKAYPEQTLGVFLMNSTPYPDTAERKKLRLHGVKVAAKNYEALVSMSVANLFSQESRVKYREEIENVKNKALKTPLAGYIACQKGMMQREDLVDFWKQSTFKKGMFLGKNDTLIDAEALKKELEGYTVEVEIGSGGHMSFIENSRSVNNALAKFLI
ncbi:MAG: alpha/beta hydrolase [Cytophagaceae bacterium]|nr:alpha/beta hydrolase [Cytophagaceae bacterium]|tara:strand:+ start:25033 stop:25803 length:771 start_codon:yes stop_codon:yes gene_type:complete